MTFRLFVFLLLAIPAFAEPYAAELSDTWRARLVELTKPRTITATFSESRHTPLKRVPVVVTGTVRIYRERGLSLSYDQKHAPLIILDDRGLLLRHPDGREQSAPPEAENDLRLLHALFAFDLVTLEKSYALVASDSPDGAWTLTFTRRPDSNAGYRELILSGNAAHLAAITLAKTPNLKTAITLASPQLNSVFNSDELARYFR
ncbi:MAG: hypothetical protein K0R17_1590 [Rariglobus sp.]|jgi:hypothetical protein|nr:hypothetical protein [Rariglobus sp.]